MLTLRRFDEAEKAAESAVALAPGSLPARKVLDAIRAAKAKGPTKEEPPR